MSVIAVASASGTVGVTTTVVALAAAWPLHRTVHVVEADPAGGDLAAWFDLEPDPGLATLATLAGTARHGLTAGALLDHTQALFSAGGIGGPVRRALLAPRAPDRAATTLAALRHDLPGALAELDGDVVVDCGRLQAGSPGGDVVRAADVVVGVAGPSSEEVRHLAIGLDHLAPGTPTGILIVADGGLDGHLGSLTIDVVGAMPLGHLRTDRRGAAAVARGDLVVLRTRRRSTLLRDAVAVTGTLLDWIDEGAGQAGGGDDGRRRSLWTSPEGWDDEEAFERVFVRFWEAS